ncbi:Ima1 N-terminal domain-containing protein [Amanita rubescens]|nr:Ima1 N-terminal domain-containing protein [Amanita rubescens]
MSALFRRHSSLRCFFCHSPILIAQDPRNFHCNACGCWNRYDKSGEILSDDPAMHDVSLNSLSFAKRGSPSKDQLPSIYSRGLFCHTCQTNQMLLVNLLSSYLPSPDSPDYHRRLEKLPEYKESLHARYPPVCDSCLPAIEEEIQNRDHMARTKALGCWLKESRGKDHRRRVSGSTKDRDHLTFEILAWRARGVLWMFSLVLALLGYSVGFFRYSIPWMVHASPLLPILVMISLLWTAWDPTYSAFRKAELQGRDVRVKGKRTYIFLQMTAWFLRLFTATMLTVRHYKPHIRPSQEHTQVYLLFTLAVEITVFAASLFVIRLQQPPAIRLINSKSHASSLSRSATPAGHSRATTPGISTHSAVEPDLTTLSLSSKPIIAPPNPSLHVLTEDLDEMDWTPTDPVAYSTFQKRKQRSETFDDDVVIRPQRFFAPEQPTGLEGLFQKTRLTDDAPSSPTNGWHLVQRTVMLHLVSSWRLYILSCIPIILGGRIQMEIKL